jgi:hypothetical protein
MASLNNLLNRVSGYQFELDTIQERLEILSEMASELVNNDYTEVEMILQTHPTNGSKAIVVPLFAKPDMMNYLATDEPVREPYQVGFQRFYPANEVMGTNMFTISIPIETRIALAVIDKAIQRLKARRTVILKRSRLILKAD